MSIRFQADADLNQIIVLATIRREPSIDFQTAGAADLAGLADLRVLQRAAREGRILVTHDQRTMPRHFGEFITAETSPGLLIVPQYLPAASVATCSWIFMGAPSAKRGSTVQSPLFPLFRPGLFTADSSSGSCRAAVLGRPG